MSFTRLAELWAARAFPDWKFVGAYQVGGPCDPAPIDAYHPMNGQYIVRFDVTDKPIDARAYVEIKVGATMREAIAFFNRTLEAIK